MAQWKRFGDVILNLDRVVKVEKVQEGTLVHLAGLPPQKVIAVTRPGRGDPKAPKEMVGVPGAELFRENAAEVWDFFAGMYGT